MIAIFDKYCDILKSDVIVFGGKSGNKLHFISKEHGNKASGMQSTTNGCFGYEMVACKLMSLVGSKKVICTGAGLGSTNRALSFIDPKIKLDYIEISPVVEEALHLFGFPSNVIMQDIETMDVPHFSSIYDTIFIDVYKNGELVVSESKLKEICRSFDFVFINTILSKKNLKKVCAFSDLAAKAIRKEFFKSVEGLNSTTSDWNTIAISGKKAQEVKSLSDKVMPDIEIYDIGRELKNL